MNSRIHIRKGFAGFQLVIGTAFAVLLAITSWSSSSKESSQSKATTTATVLSGVVSSDAEKVMEGVLVSAKQVGSKITLTVVSDKQGRYRFPAGKLKPGQYDISIRATGYDLSKPDMTVTLDQGVKEFNLKLNKTQDLGSQLSSAEWFESIPGTPEQKNMLYSRCMICHTANPIVSSNYDAAAWVVTITRMMNWGPGSSIKKPEPLPFHRDARPEDVEFGKYLSSINLSSKSKWDFELKTFPRPSGNATKVIITEYDLPRADAMPHDVVRDSEGMFWYIDFSEPILGRMDPNTGETKEWPLPKMGSQPLGGSLDLELDRDGNPWIARLLQGGVTKFDKKTEKMTSWSLPKEYANPKSRVGMLAFGPRGTVWFIDSFNRSIYLLDPATGHIDHYLAYPDWIPPALDMGSGGRGDKPLGHFIYGFNADQRGVGYFADMAGGNIGEIDPQTGKVRLYPTPTVNSGPRRMHVDAEGKLWFAENYAFKIGLFDPETKKMQEWDDPIPWDGPYDVTRDKDGYVWAGGEMTDLVSRLNPKTGELIQYLLPTEDTNIRRVEVNNLTDPPSFFTGETHQAKIAFVQPQK